MPANPTEMKRRLDVSRAARAVERLRRQADVLAACYPDVRGCPLHVREEITAKRRAAAAIEDAVLNRKPDPQTKEGPR